jgi:hypothetical protein
VIHADLFTDNVFFIGRAVSGLIDFYFACTDALAYDLAICLNAWCFEADGSFNLTKGGRMIAATRPCAARSREVEALPVLCRGSALRFMLTRLVDWLNVPPGALVRPEGSPGIRPQARLPPPRALRDRIRPGALARDRLSESFTDLSYDAGRGEWFADLSYDAGRADAAADAGAP